MEQEGALPMVLHVTDAAESLMEMEMMDAMDDESMDDDDKDVENMNYIYKNYKYPAEPLIELRELTGSSSPLIVP